MDKDHDLDDPQSNALTTPDLDGDDVQKAGDGKEVPSEPSAQGFEPESNPENTRTDRDPAEGGDVPEARPA